MDAEEHSVIMQQVKELEVRSEMVSSQYAAAQGRVPTSGWCWGAAVPLGPRVRALGYGVRWAVLAESPRSCLLS